jgi:hypothetical protein
MREETILTLMFTGMGMILVFVSSAFLIPGSGIITGSATTTIKNTSGIILAVIVALSIIGLILILLGIRGTLKRNKITATAFISTGDPLSDYIRYAKGSKSNYEIKSELMSVGWAEEDIDNKLN